MADILNRIRTLEEFSVVPDEQIQWLLNASEERNLSKDQFLFRPGEAADELYLLVGGALEIYIENSAGRQGEMELRAPILTGVLPFSRLTHAQGYGRTILPTRLYALHRKYFPEMVRTHYELTQAMVHFMTSRVRQFTRQSLHNEKMMALGKMSAGLAHELNNPSAAIGRSSHDLSQVLEDLEKDIMTLEDLNEATRKKHSLLSLMMAGEQASPSMLAKRRLLSAMADVLDENGIHLADEVVELLAENGIQEKQLTGFLEHVGTKSGKALLPIVAHLMEGRKLTKEIGVSANRISDLVNSIKRFTHMDRARQKEHVDIHLGVQDSLVILDHKIGKRGIRVSGNFREKGPISAIHPGDMGQVWTNLLDNAADAVKDTVSPEISINSRVEEKHAVLSVCDNGPGIPTNVLNRIFDPFFTTKSIGEGTGMGLETSRKIVEYHAGRIWCTSEPGHTCFFVRLPVNAVQ